MSALKMALEIIDFYCFNITSKGFLTMFIGIPYLTMCATRTEMTQVLKNILLCSEHHESIFRWAQWVAWILR